MITGIRWCLKLWNFSFERETSPIYVYVNRNSIHGAVGEGGIAGQAHFR
jgi:hypothetical protein